MPVGLRVCEFAFFFVFYRERFVGARRRGKVGLGHGQRVAQVPQREPLFLAHGGDERLVLRERKGVEPAHALHLVVGRATTRRKYDFKKKTLEREKRKKKQEAVKKRHMHSAPIST